jgi:hypothetical protein
MNALVHLLNWYFGWLAILVGFSTGAAIGLFFHREEFLGGYTSFRRRIVRLGHIALPALGMMNLIYSLSPWPVTDLPEAHYASVCFVIGGITMPLVCFLTGWKASFRHLFFIPVTSLILAVVFTLKGTAP